MLESNMIVIVSPVLNMLLLLVGSAATKERILGAATMVVNVLLGDFKDHPMALRASHDTESEVKLDKPDTVTLAAVLNTVCKTNPESVDTDT